MGKGIDFGIDSDGLLIGEANGTVIPIQGIKKRGKEMKVFVQLRRGGGVSIAGLAIGDYDSGWDKIFKPLVKCLKKFKWFLLVTDGERNILGELKGKLDILVQRCLWHIPYQMKYYLWKDGVKRKSKKWLHALSEIFDICSIRYYLDDDEVTEEMVQSKEKRLNELILCCEKRGWKNSVVYLEHAKSDMFVAIRNRLNGQTTSRAERVMRTINLRIKVGK